jgi:hypothetical protein
MMRMIYEQKHKWEEVKLRKDHFLGLRGEDEVSSRPLLQN